MKKGLFILFLAASALLLPTFGCATLDDNSSTAAVRLAEDGRIYVGKTYTGLTKLVAKLQSDGIKPSVRIIVEIPQNTSPNAINAISRELVSNGYRRILFNKPRRATAQKGVDPLTGH